MNFDTFKLIEYYFDSQKKKKMNIIYSSMHFSTPHTFINLS